jgi:predicted RNase H-like HicB family nuclease
MKESAHYIKLVIWSDEDQSFIGQCPSIIGPCCHGPNETQVYAELCQIVDEWIELMKQKGIPLPTPTTGQNIVEQIANCSLPSSA